MKLLMSTAGLLCMLSAWTTPIAWWAAITWVMLPTCWRRTRTLESYLDRCRTHILLCNKFVRDIQRQAPICSPLCCELIEIVVIFLPLIHFTDELRPLFATIQQAARLFRLAFESVASLLTCLLLYFMLEYSIFVEFYTEALTLVCF